jgi:hypothetical protein
VKIIVPPWAWPLSFYQIHGTMCCHRMRMSYDERIIIKGSYEARTLSEANVLLVWGSLTQKLARLIGEQIDAMVSNHFIVHIRGCDHRVDNQATSSSLIALLPINSVVSSCTFDQNQIKVLKAEIRQCLRA